MKKRDPFFDNAKLLLMFLVVLGHVLPINKNDSFNLATYNWIFSFHMPLFIFISGFFTNIENNNNFWSGITKLVETFIVFTLVHFCITLIRGRCIGIDVLFVPRWTLWYLLSLIWWKLILHFFPERIRDNSFVLITISLLLCLTAGWIPLGQQLSFQRTFYFMPFFIFGYLAKQKNITVSIKPFYAFLFLAIIWLLYYVLQWRNNILLQQYDNSQYGQQATLIFCVRIGLLLLASIMSICFLSLVPKKEHFWTRFGKYTLFIYMWHSVILSWRYDIRDSLNIPTSLPFCFIYSGIVLVIIYFLSKIKFFHWLLNPITPIVQKRK